MLFLDRSIDTTSPRKKSGPLRVASRIATALGAALLLASCGGGDQKETFQASRVIVFGDETSLINDGVSDTRFPAGSKFTLNIPSPTPGVPPCALNPLWVEYVASMYGHVFAECNPRNLTPRAFMRAKFDAKVADVKVQIDNYLASNSLNKSDMVTLMAGNNDILAQLANAHASPPASEATMVAAVEQAGTLLGDQVLRITSTQAKVIVATLPDLSLSPLGRTSSPSDRALLNRLTVRFNDKLRLRLSADPNGGGRSGALLSADDSVALFTINIGNQYGFANTTEAACFTTSGNGVTPMPTVDLPNNCTSTAFPTAGLYLWGGATQLSSSGHAQLGALAQAALRRNPL